MSNTAQAALGAAAREPHPSGESGRGTDAPLRGILLLVAAMALFSCSDVTAKFLNRTLQPTEIAWLRYLAYAVFMLPLLLRSRGRVLRSAAPRLQLLRGAGMFGSAVIFVTATRYLPLADATATAFVSPLFITALSIPFLGERVGRHRWGAVAAGLVGVMVIVRPGGAGFQPASLLPILSAVCWAAAVILTRRMAGSDSLATTLVYTAFTGLVIATLLVPNGFRVPSLAEAAGGFLIGIFATGAQSLVAAAYRQADASLLAPFAYSQIVWATALGYLVFGAMPDRQTLAGAALIIASGLYTAHRERVVAQERSR